MKCVSNVYNLNPLEPNFMRSREINLGVITYYAAFRGVYFLNSFTIVRHDRRTLLFYSGIIIQFPRILCSCNPVIYTQSFKSFWLRGEYWTEIHSFRYSSMAMKNVQFRSGDSKQRPGVSLREIATTTTDKALHWIDKKSHAQPQTGSKRKTKIPRSRDTYL